MAGYPESERAVLREAARSLRATSGGGTLARGAEANAWRRLALVLGVLLAFVAALFVARTAPPQTSDPDLARLVGAMGWIKGGLVACAAAVLHLRFRWPVATSVATGYLLAVWTGTFAAVMIAQVAYVGSSALAFHLAALGAITLAAVEGRKSRAPASASRDR